MIKKYIIDGNNLIGKIPEIYNIQKSDKQLSRVKLVRIIDPFFNNKKIEVSLHFDGYANTSIPSSNIKIYYSNNVAADLKIREEIDNTHSTRTTVIVSSDHEVQNYAKVNSCKVVSSEKFAKQLNQKNNKINEEDIQKSISNDEIKKIFGLD